MENFIVAAIQMTSVNDRDENLNKANILLSEGIERGASLLALPENFSFMGKEEEKTRVVEDLESGISLRFLKEFAFKKGVWIMGGSIPVKADSGKMYNTSLLINDNGDIAARYDKIHLFDVDIAGGESHRESKLVEPGKEPVTVDTPLGRLGLSICYDLRFPELYRSLTQEGAKIIFSPAAFTVETGLAHWEILIRARAIENQVYMIAPAQYGTHSSTRRTFGHAMIVDPWGKVLAKAADRETVITAEIDFSYQDEVRQGLPCLRHRRF
ncbi:MAG: carbon-nitrogen hydrolase family protein [Deltaproteobacteria bacterium]|nr:carbon-nitrogen hydrolase family protein [Deltaproteobacteria bacterium]